MTKYIDAEKLIALLEQRKKQLAQWTDKEYANQRIDEIDCILDVDIDSLRQEQQDMDLDANIEKDLALTWKDMKRISRILDIMVDDDIKGEIPEEWGEEEYYEEVLRRFNKAKED